MEPVGSARRRRPRSLLAAAAVLAAMLTGCGVVPSANPEASSLELAAAFAPCQEGVGVFSSGARSEPVGEVEAVHEWVRVVEVMEADREEDGHAAATVRDEADQVRRPQVWQDTWPAVDWALQHDAEVWFGMAEPGTMIAPEWVSLALIVTRAGSAFFAVGCFDHYLRGQVAEALGDRIDEAFAELPRVASADVREHLGVLRPEPPESDEVALSEGYVKRHGLTALKMVGFEAAITDVVEDAQVAPVICARIGAGWGECFVPDGSTVRGGAGAIAWVDEDGVLEFWLLDEYRELTLDHPLGKLGEVQTGRRSVHVQIDTSGIAADGSFEGDDRVTIVE